MPQVEDKPMNVYDITMVDQDKGVLERVNAAGYIQAAGFFNFYYAIEDPSPILSINALYVKTIRKLDIVKE